jgi:hypothetical protein
MEDLRKKVVSLFQFQQAPIFGADNRILNQLRGQVNELLKYGTVGGFDVRPLLLSFVAPLIPVAIAAAPAVYGAVRSAVPGKYRKKMRKKLW